MNPTIGRIVIYHPCSDSRNDDVFSNGSAKDVPAIIVAVWGRTCVNLKVIADGPRDTWVTSVTLDESETPQPRTWSWPQIAPIPNSPAGE